MTEHINNSGKYTAGFWIRLAAFGTDSTALTMISAVIGMVVSGFDAERALRHTPAIYILLSAPYFVILTLTRGQTIGKIVANISVVDANGSLPSIWSVFLREIVGKSFSLLIPVIGIGMILFDEQKRALHDRIAGTFVIRSGVLSQVKLALLIASALMGIFLFFHNIVTLLFNAA